MCIWYKVVIGVLAVYETCVYVRTNVSSTMHAFMYCTCLSSSSSDLKVIGERDILGTQLIRRNDELALLYEKIKIQQSTLTKGGAGTHIRTYVHLTLST